MLFGFFAVNFTLAVKRSLLRKVLASFRGSEGGVLGIFLGFFTQGSTLRPKPGRRKLVGQRELSRL